MVLGSIDTTLILLTIFPVFLFAIGFPWLEMHMTKGEGIEDSAKEEKGKKLGKDDTGFVFDFGLFVIF